MDARRLLLTCLVLILGAPAAVAAAPFSAQVGDDFFAPRSLQVSPGDTVTWNFTGQSVHTVTSRADVPARFDSDLRQKGDPPFTVRFDRPGRYAYFCQIHSDMTGVVQVGPPDTVDPVLSRLSARPGRICARGVRGCRHPGTRFRFRLSEAAKVSASIASVRHPRRVLKRVSSRRLGGGSRSLGYNARGLRPGSYRATLVARDQAGNASAKRTVRFRVVRPG